MKKILLFTFIQITLQCAIFSAQKVTKQVLNTQTQKVYLSGTGKDNTVDWQFFCSKGRKSGKWSTIAVPSCWEQEGFGSYNYGHDQRLGKEVHDESGIYKHSFNAPAEWKNKEVKIVFEGVMTDAEVKINGIRAGEIHQGAFYEFKYSITKLLKYGEENVLEVKVNKVSSNESINYAERNADFWIFGGIYRPVYLQVLPKEHIKRVAIDAKANGEITADLFVNASRAKVVSAALHDLNGQLVQELNIIKSEQLNEKWTIKTKANNIKTWNPEKPNLYNLVLFIKDKKGNVLHEVEQRIGFRTVELLEGDGVYVNGVRIKFKGINRHSFHPESGRTTSKAMSIDDVKLMKDMNMNAVRLSHYPSAKHFLNVCDSLGLFVMNEVCTWHSPHLDTEVGRKIVKETVIRDVNHPSILLWANGNESGWNTELDDDYAIWDIQKREVVHPWGIFRKTNTLHYLSYHGFTNDIYTRDKIIFPTEFLHGLYDGGHGAGLDDYWNLMWNLPRSAGGFLWNFTDEAIARTDKGGELDTDGNHAADGILGPYGEKEASYFTVKEVWSPIYLEDRVIKKDFSGVFNIENRYHYTNLEECKMKAKWVKYNGPNGHLQPKVMYENEIELPPLTPSMKGSITVNKPTDWDTSDALHLTAYAPNGHEIFTWTYPVQCPAHLNAQLVNNQINEKVKSSIKNGVISVTANNINFSFSEETGMLQKVIKQNTTIPLTDGPIILGHTDKIERVTLENYDEKVEIVALYEKTLKTPKWLTWHKEYSSDSIIWTINSNGTLDVRVTMKGEKSISEFKGITFSYPETEVDGKKWLGDGPYRVWRNRLKGTKFQVWENDYNNTVTGESGFVYPEFKGYYSNIYWAKIKGKNNNGFTVYCHTPYTYLRMLTPENPKGDDRGYVSVDFPKGDLSFLKNIPAIGTKSQHSDTMGPHGQTDNIFGRDDEALVIELTFEF